MVSERDLGSSLLFFTLFLVLIWVATERASYLAVGVALFAGARPPSTPSATCRSGSTSGSTVGQGPGLPGGAGGVRHGRRRRLGTGLALGSPTKIPVVESDMIFAAIGEELGLLGATAVLIAFLLMIGAGLRIAQQAARGFERLLAVGLTTLLGFQAFIIMAGVTRLLPLTGVTLPFISYGGSSLLANYVLLALLLRISNDSAERQPSP